jgi:hypothetical protein
LALGLCLYGLLVVTILLGGRLLASGFHFNRFIIVYSIVIGVASIGTVIEFLELFPNADILGTERMGFTWYRYLGGDKLHREMNILLHSGLFRSPDIMGWHTATACMLVFGLGVARQRVLAGILCFIASGGFLFCVVVAGRRKMLYMIPLFLATLCVLYVKKRLRIRRQAVGVAVMLMTLFCIALAMNKPLEVREYYTRTLGDSLPRVAKHGVGAVYGTVVRQRVFWGKGLGTGMQGRQHLHLDDVVQPQMWQEGGLSRIAAELGVPGLIAFLTLVVCSSVFTSRRVRRLWTRAEDGERKSDLGGQPSENRDQPGIGIRVQAKCDVGDQKWIVVTLVGILAANFLSFIVSGQIYNDPAILALTGLMTGMLLGFDGENEEQRTHELAK